MYHLRDAIYTPECIFHRSPIKIATMADVPKHPSIVEKIGGQCYLVSKLSPHIESRRSHSFTSENYFHGGSSQITVQAPAEKGKYAFLVDFMMGGVSGAVSKTAAAPIERVKLLIQNQDEMIKSGRLSEPYKGISNCFARTVKDEGVLSLWRGNAVNVMRYFPTQVIFIFSVITLESEIVICIGMVKIHLSNEYVDILSICKRIPYL